MTVLDQIRGLASQGISRAAVEATIGRPLTKDELQAYLKAQTVRRLRRAKDAQEAKRRAREAADAAILAAGLPLKMKKDDKKE